MYHNYSQEHYNPYQYPAMCPMMMYRMEDIEDDRMDKGAKPIQQVSPMQYQQPMQQPIKQAPPPVVSPIIQEMKIQPTMQPQTMGLTIQPTIEPSSMEFTLQPKMEQGNMELNVQPKMEPSSMELNIQPKMGSITMEPIKLQLTIQPVMEPTKMMLNIQPVIQPAQWPVMQQPIMMEPMMPMPNLPCNTCHHKKIKSNLKCNDNMSAVMPYQMDNAPYPMTYPAMMEPMDMQNAMMPFSNVPFDDEF